MLGYDLKTMNTNSESLDKMNGNHPDAILVRKVYGDAARRKQKRKWMLKRLIEGKHQASVSLKNTIFLYLKSDKFYLNSIIDVYVSDDSKTVGIKMHKKR